jgi:hypothetical protein
VKILLFELSLLSPLRLQWLPSYLETGCLYPGEISITLKNFNQSSLSLNFSHTNKMDLITLRLIEETEYYLSLEGAKTIWKKQNKLILANG